jgi:hypothetical protein
MVSGCGNGGGFLDRIERTFDGSAFEGSGPFDGAAFGL